MIKKAIKTITLSAAMITMMSVFGHTTKVDAANITGTVTATSLNVRSGASTSYSIVGKVTKGEEVEILSALPLCDGSVEYSTSRAIGNFKLDETTGFRAKISRT